MATIAPAPTVRDNPPIVFDNISWQTYLELLEARGERRYNMTYDHGVLEIMTRSQLHERLCMLLNQFVLALTHELGIELASVGSTTMHSESLAVGGEADQSYYIRQEPIVRARDEYDPEVDPPPDLVVEVDLSSTSELRMKVYADLGVPEVWRYDGEHLAFHALQSNGSYTIVDRSLSFPDLSSADLERFINRRGSVGENTLIREFRAWFRGSSGRTQA